MTLASLTSYFGVLLAVARIGHAAVCTHTVIGKAGDSCVSVATANSLTVSQFLQLNPTVHSCSLSAGETYCISSGTAVTSVSPSVSPTSATPTPLKPTFVNTTSPVATSTADTPVPTSAGLIPSPDGSDGICGGQYTCLGSVYGDCCSANGYCGNSTEYCGEGCNPLYGTCGVCPVPMTVTALYTTTSILLSTTTATALVTVTAPASTVTVTRTVAPTGRPVQTPSPTFPGVTRNCGRWYLVKATDNCRRVAYAFGTTQAQIVSWNPGFDCDDMEDMAGNYICVGVQSAFGGF